MIHWLHTQKLGAGVGQNLIVAGQRGHFREEGVTKFNSGSLGDKKNQFTPSTL